VGRCQAWVQEGRRCVREGEGGTIQIAQRAQPLLLAHALHRRQQLMDEQIEDIQDTVVGRMRARSIVHTPGARIFSSRASAAQAIQRVCRGSPAGTSKVSSRVWCVGVRHPARSRQSRSSTCSRRWAIQRASTVIPGSVLYLVPQAGQIFISMVFFHQCLIISSYPSLEEGLLPSWRIGRQINDSKANMASVVAGTRFLACPFSSVPIFIKMRQ
jgi:hypothetical protein